MAKNDLISATRFYQGLGFFARLGGLSDDELVSRLEKLYAQRFDTDEGQRLQDKDFGASGADLVLLSLDADRVWWHDYEADMTAGKDFYIDLVKTLGRISRGAFRPE